MAKNWSLKEIYKGFDDEKIEQDIKTLEGYIKSLNEDLTKMKNDADFCEVMKKQEKLDALSGRLQAYAGLAQSADTSSKEAGQLKNRVAVLMTETASFDPRIIAYISKHEDVEKLIESSDYLKEIAFVLRKFKNKASHILPDETEELLSQLRIDAASSWKKLFNLLTSTVEAELPDGRMVSLPVVRSMAGDASRDVRKSAYEAELKCYEKIEHSVAAALSSIKGEVITIAKARNYPSPLDMTLEESNMSRKSLEALISTIKRNLPMLRQYYKKKAERMGHKKGLPFYDINAPLGESRKYSYDEAKTFVLDAFSTYSEALKSCAEQAFQNDWIDVEPKKGKVGGAFCYPLPQIGEFRILLNFEGSFRDLLTLAHELGHGYHGLVAKDVNYHNLDYPMTLAETASTFCETVVYEKLLAEGGDKSVLEFWLSDISAIIIDIYSRYLFETRVFEERKKAQPSAEDFKQYMIEAQKEAYGDALDPELLHPYMWACKGHYYSADLSFYNFPYSFGQMFATALYAQFKKEGSSFHAKYDELLKSAGSLSVEDACAIMGIDPTKEEFWQSSFDRYEELVNQYIA